ncbi:LysM peptidoglycan-binding domain-containing protein [Acidiphilium sp. AL]|uniref:LysM peptidoglycan-binding domain-containing protein n=1 Tax=Acidiphilium iwatense TaxID=768198 RepID=A0ABS9E025_9PROT|nr:MULTISPECIES: LysM domain-containing protein [Acidiphilium]MCF3948346.1 LysM peptidoglycan-binding domain-containing protein [Acidiphilium iwatense]MCU4161287.1 LysM peptidoglycan-binding domain-containing protein [Acidiphilium sp. AL]
MIDKKDVKTVTVERGDSLYAIARRVGTTEQVLRDLNRHTPLFPLKIGTKSTYSPAKIVTVITG